MGKILREAPVTKCPECGGVLDIEEDEVEDGEVITCPDCGSDLEVVNTHPLELDILEEEEEEEAEKSEEDREHDEYEQK